MASQQIRALHAALATLLLLGHFSCLAESRLHTHFPNRGKTMLQLLPQGRKLLGRTSALAPPPLVGNTLHRRDEPPAAPPDEAEPPVDRCKNPTADGAYEEFQNFSDCYDGEEEPSDLAPEPEPEPDEGDPPETSCDDEPEPEPEPEPDEGNPPDTSSEDTPWVEGPEPDEGDPPETSCDDEPEPEPDEGNPPDTSGEDSPWVEGPEREPEADGPVGGETPDSGDAGNTPREDLN